MIWWQTGGGLQGPRQKKIADELKQRAELIQKEYAKKMSWNKQKMTDLTLSRRRKRRMDR